MTKAICGSVCFGLWKKAFQRVRVHGDKVEARWLEQETESSHLQATIRERERDSERERETDRERERHTDQTGNGTNL